MSSSKIRFIARWNGWCGACAGERPLVLTRTGRWSLRAWLAGTDDEERQLILTCRICGVGVVVPHEEDDPDPEAGDTAEPDDDVVDEVAAAAEAHPVLVQVALGSAGPSRAAAVSPVLVDPPVGNAAPADEPELVDMRARLARSIGALATRRLLDAGLRAPSRALAAPPATSPLQPPAFPLAAVLAPRPAHPADSAPTAAACDDGSDDGSDDESALHLLSAGLDPSAFLFGEPAGR